MNVLLAQMDGKIPNIALMRIAQHHRSLGDDVELYWAGHKELIHNEWFIDHVYISAIFRSSLPAVERMKRMYPSAIVGGTAVDPPRAGEVVPLSPVIQSQVTSLESLGIIDPTQDYTDYPRFKQSIGFTQRGCRLKCSFCVVPTKEGRVHETASIYDIWRGDPHPRELILLDNDFFGQPNWRTRIKEIRDGGFKVSFNQGINARCLTEEAAEAIASVDYRDDQMKDKRIYTAWDSRADEERLFTGLNRLVRFGVRPDNIMVYMLVGYWPGETEADREYRRRKLRDFGARPYPMPYIRTKELIGFQRWVVRRIDLMCSWEDFKAADFRPEKLKTK